MSTIRNLPDELLVHLFEIGCEVEPLDPGLIHIIVRHNRRLKPFASLSRRVCSKWRRIIVDPHHRAFWVTSAWLDGRAGSPRIPPLARQFHLFRRSILSSCGSDIHITLSFHSLGVFESNEDLDHWPSIDTSRLKLYIYAVLFLASFRHQITRLTLTSSKLAGMKHLLQAFTQICPLPRMTYLNLAFKAPEKEAQVSIEAFKNLQGDLGFRPLRVQSGKLPSCLHPVIPRLQTLVLHRQVHPWLADLGHQVFRLSELEVTVIGGALSEDALLLATLATNQSLAESLRNLRISFHFQVEAQSGNPQQNLEVASIKNSTTVSNCIHLPHLQSLTIWVHGPKAERLFHHMLCRVVFPSMTAVALHFPPSADLPEIEDLPATQITRTPSLRFVYASLSLNDFGIQPLVTFEHCHETIKELEIYIHNRTARTAPNQADPRVKERLQSILVRLRLQVFSFMTRHQADWTIFVLILRALVAESIEELRIVGPQLGRWDTLPKHLGDTYPSFTAGRFAMPALKRLTIKDVDILDFLWLFRILDTDNLQNLSISLGKSISSHVVKGRGYFTSKNIGQQPPPKSFLTISSISATLYISPQVEEPALLRLLDDIAPNVRDLDIITKRNDLNSYQGIDVVSKLHQLYRSLSPNDRPGVFSKLNRLRIRAFMDRKPTDSEIEESRKIAVEMCRGRSDVEEGSTILNLDLFDVMRLDKAEYYGLGRGWLVDVWASAP